MAKKINIELNLRKKEINKLKKVLKIITNLKKKIKNNNQELIPEPQEILPYSGYENDTNTDFGKIFVLNDIEITKKALVLLEKRVASDVLTLQTWKDLGNTLGLKIAEKRAIDSITEFWCDQAKENLFHKSRLESLISDFEKENPNK